MENLDGGTSRRDHSENPDRGTSRRDANTNYITHRSSRISRHVAGASCKRKDMIRESQQERVGKAIGSGQLSTGT